MINVYRVTFQDGSFLNVSADSIESAYAHCVECYEPGFSIEQLKDNHPAVIAARNVDGSRLVAIETVKAGEYVRLVRAGKPTNKTYKAHGYERSMKAYCVEDCDDVWCGSIRYLKKGTLVYVGFTY